MEIEGPECAFAVSLDIEAAKDLLQSWSVPQPAGEMVGSLLALARNRFGD